MKKFLCLLIVMLMTASLVACGNNSSSESVDPEQEKILASVDEILTDIGNATAEIEKVGGSMQQEKFGDALTSIKTACAEFKKAIDACGDTTDFASMKATLQNIYNQLNTLAGCSGTDSGIEDKISTALDGCETYFESMGKEIDETWVTKYNLPKDSES